MYLKPFEAPGNQLQPQRKTFRRRHTASALRNRALKCLAAAPETSFKVVFAYTAALVQRVK